MRPPSWGAATTGRPPPRRSAGAPAEKMRPNWSAEAALGGEPREERAERGCAAASGRPSGFARSSRMLPLKSSAPPILDPELAAQLARHQLGRHRGAHVVGDDEDRRRCRRGARAPRRVGLPGERVVVVARLLGEAEAEEVERERRPSPGAAPAASASRRSSTGSRAGAAAAAPRPRARRRESERPSAATRSPCRRQSSTRLGQDAGR